MGVTLTDAEIWEFLEGSFVGILTTLKSDGTPVALPIWYAVLDRHVYVRTPAASRKAARARRDPRASFLVESGIAWAELKAVHLSGLLTVVRDPDERARALAAIDAKYADHRPPQEKLPEATVRHYAVERAVLRLDHRGKTLSWDNAKIRARVLVDGR